MEITPKSTKNEILAAYEEMLKKVQEMKSDAPKQQQTEQKKEETIKKASALTTDSIINNLASLKVQISKELDALGEQLVAEQQKLETVQQAIGLENKNLEELYQISANTDSLVTILMAQKEKKEVFEREMNAKTEAFESSMAQQKELFETEIKTLKEQRNTEKTLWENQQKELKSETDKKRIREEEEYTYTLNLERKKEADAYLEKKLLLDKELKEKQATFEKEISEREQLVRDAETELRDLRVKVDKFPTELQKAIAETEKKAIEKLTIQFDFEKQLTDKQNEGETKLKEQTIETLRQKLKEQEAFIKELSDKANLADKNVKDIAIKAIESSGKMQVYEKVVDSNSRS